MLVLQENILLEPMFEVPGTDIVDVIITEDVVKGIKSADYVRRPRDVPAEVEEDNYVAELSARQS